MAVAGTVTLPPSHRRGHPGAVEGRLPDAVLVDPAARPAGPRRWRQEPGDSGAASPARCAPPPGSTAEAGACRPGTARCGQPRPAEIPLVVLPRQARDPAALASAAGRRRVDLSTPDGPTTIGSGGAAADRPLSQGEPAVGLPAYPGRAATARHPGLCIRNPRHPPPARPRPRTAADRHLAAGVPAPAGRRDPGVRPASPSTPSGCGGRRCCSSSSWAPCGCRKPVHFTRPGHTRGSARRADRVARPVRWPRKRTAGQPPSVAPGRASDGPMSVVVCDVV